VQVLVALVILAILIEMQAMIGTELARATRVMASTLSVATGCSKKSGDADSTSFTYRIASAAVQPPLASAHKSARGPSALRISMRVAASSATSPFATLSLNAVRCI
jgi:hypothetical protein